MKRNAVTFNLSKIRHTFQTAGVIGKTTISLSLFTLCLFILLGVGSILQSRLSTSPVSSMKGLAASVSNQFFLDMLGLEVPHLRNDTRKFTFSQQNMMSFAVRFLTDVNPGDPKSLIAQEVPGLKADKSTVLRGGKDGDASGPVEYTPAEGAVNGTTGGTVTGATPAPTPAPSQAPADQKPKGPGRNIAFIYQSHSNESFLPELKGVTDPDKAYDAKTNIIMVGKKLAEALEKEGVGAVHSDAIYPNTIKDFKYSYSYKYSLQTLEAAANSHPDLKFFFDIHRDSQERKRTTVTLNGKDYAQVYFILGGDNPKWKENEAFAGKIHDALEAKAPGVSKGIHAKTGHEVNGVYNQNFSPNSVLIEVGGPYNSLEECYRTVELLAKAVSEVILDAEKVTAPAEGKKS
ncbi:stage II sporulation protein P [Paenibacillus sp. UNC499MF]|uniref:stage II sporulation protein P n=1 Tax=Paenibacillus sp. UNC499MF TaxID=1502751 RepID=UPI0008A042CF|nr:stage II sporulation protein P [Paenibacillus sp. UNC499MF]SEF48247.1 stage II sporulation protein P [Paenibacillus sp. UNC499MF]